MISLFICSALGGFIVYKVSHRGSKVWAIIEGGLIGFFIWFLLFMVLPLKLGIVPSKTFVLEENKKEIILSNDSGEENFLFLFLDEDGRLSYKFQVEVLDSSIIGEPRIIPAKEMLVCQEKRMDAYFGERYIERKCDFWFYLWIIPRYFRPPPYKNLEQYIAHIPLGGTSFRAD